VQPLNRTRPTASGLRRASRTARDLCRQLTSAGRALPHFVVAGVQKGGTTSLFKHLADDPGVVPPVVKEIHFFDRHHARGLEWYRSHFPLTARLAGRLTGEASPSYLFEPAALQRLAAALPEVKVLVALRDPVERAFSHYRMKVSRGIETLPFGEALDREDERLADDGDPVATALRRRHFSYLARSRYLEQLLELQRHVPASRVLVLRSEDLFDAERQEGALQRLGAFLGLPRLPSRPLRHSNRGTVDQRLDPSLRRRLVEHFAPMEAALTARFGPELSWKR
jgi:hypothetical protein